MAYWTWSLFAWDSIFYYENSGFFSCWKLTWKFWPLKLRLLVFSYFSSSAVKLSSCLRLKASDLDSSKYWPDFTPTQTFSAKVMTGQTDQKAQFLHFSFSQSNLSAYHYFSSYSNKVSWQLCYRRASKRETVWSCIGYFCHWTCCQSVPQRCRNLS